MHDRAAQLTIELPNGRVSHPVTAGNVCAVIARLAPHLPAEGTWHVTPARSNLT